MYFMEWHLNHNKTMIKIYYPPAFSNTREYRMIQQGLINNPNVKLVNNEKDSDFVFQFYYRSKHKKFYTETYPRDKTVVIDYHDNPGWASSIKCKAYFKRSWVEPTVRGYTSIKEPVERSDNFHPITFAIMDEFIVREKMERDILLSCPLRVKDRHKNRLRALEAIDSMDIKGETQIGELNRGSMRSFNDVDMKGYFRLLKRSRIVVTCNPDPWEGDHRTWEAFASGAMVFIDRMFTPIPHPLIDGKHCIFYDISGPGLESLKKKVRYYLDNPSKAEVIAKEGHEFTMKYHRTSSRIDEILEVIL